MTALREIRESKGFTIKDMSKGAEIPVSTLYDIESGRRGLVANKAEKMADFLGVPIEKLFKPTYYRVLTIPE